MSDVAMGDVREARAECPRCERPIAVCYCAHLPALRTETRVVVLQHPREEGMPIGTGRMANLGLIDSELYVGVRFEGALLDKVLGDGAREPVLLWPGPGARDLSERAGSAPVSLIVIDGTWAQAKSLVRRNPELAALPRYAFVPPAPSNYRIRREPRAEYLSTIESLALVLGLLEGDPQRFAALHAPFEAMVNSQLSYMRQSVPRHRLRKPQRAPKPKRFPPLLTDRANDLVCVVAQANAASVPNARRNEENPGELIHCVALRVSEPNDRLELLLRPTAALAAGTAEQIEILPSVLEGGLAMEGARARWEQFRRPTDVLVTWGTHTSRVLAAAGLAVPSEQVDLRKESRILENRRVGSVETFHAFLGLQSQPIGQGRAGRWLGMLTAITRHLTGGVPVRPRQ